VLRIEAGCGVKARCAAPRASANQQARSTKHKAGGSTGEGPANEECGEQGAALLIAVIAMMLLAGLALGLVVVSMTETRIAGNYRVASETSYAADAMLERVVQDLTGVPHWSDALSGLIKSGLIDSTRRPVLPSGDTVDLDAMTTDLRSDANLSGQWGANNPQWQLFAWGSTKTMTGLAVIDTRLYVAGWIGDDPSEQDGKPTVDSNGMVAVHVVAFGPGHAQRAVDAVVARVPGSSAVRILSWRQMK
jgi:hypothetical protein